MSKVTDKGFYYGYVASAYWSTNKLSEPTHYIGYVTLKDDDINELKHFGSALITCFSVDGLGDVYPCYQQDFTPMGFNLSKDNPVGKHDYGNKLALVFEDDVPRELSNGYNEQLAEKELTGDLSQDDANWNHHAVNLEQNNLVPKNENGESKFFQGKISKRLNVILKVITELGFNPISIPTGGKTDIWNICNLNHKELFPSRYAFNKAWEERNGLFNMANHESYAKRNK